LAYVLQHAIEIRRRQRGGERKPRHQQDHEGSGEARAWIA
jgi:hypothetical protein